MATPSDEIAAAMRALEFSADTARLLVSDERIRALEAVAHRYVQEPNRCWWWEVFRCRSFIVTFVEPTCSARNSRRSETQSGEKSARGSIGCPQ